MTVHLAVQLFFAANCIACGVLAKSLADVDQCILERQNSCSTKCAAKLPEELRDAVVGCISIEFDKIHDQYWQCLNQQGINQDTPCFRGNITIGIATDDDQPVKRNQLSTQLTAFKVCEIKCFRHKKTKCTKGCQVVDDTTLDSVYSCGRRIDFGRMRENVRTCVISAVFDDQTKL